jgi:hypothetical protein
VDNVCILFSGLFAYRVFIGEFFYTKLLFETLDILKLIADMCRR